MAAAGNCKMKESWTEWDPIVQGKNGCQICFDLEKFQDIIHSKEMTKEGSEGP